MGDAFARLEGEYCPPLDPALLSAILSDYALGSKDDVQSARATLDELRESALWEEAAGFDASGTGGQEAEEDTTRGSQREASHPERSSSPSWLTDLTSLSNGLSSVDVEDQERGNDRIGHAENLERLDEDSKILLLQELFGEHVGSYSIRHTLQKCNGKWNAAMEELLNHVYFGDGGGGDDGERISAKSIDAFSDYSNSDYTTFKHGRKGKPKRRRFQEVDGPGPARNKWRGASEDVDFISNRTGIVAATVRSVYYERAASVPHTIGALLKASMDESKLVVTDDAAVAAEAQSLHRHFPTIAPAYLTALIRITHPSSIAAHELAKALTAKAQDSPGRVEVIPRYAPVDNSILSGSSALNCIPGKDRSALSSQPLHPDTADLAALADTYQAARATAFAQVSAAHRKAKSDRLLGGAAAYYGQVGRHYSALSSGASAAAADALAASQSTAAQLDLHGIDVLNGVRIAREKVEAWHGGLGDRGVNGRLRAGDGQMGYRIVVGLGRHSEGGKGKLGPAVSKMLRSEGWKIEPAGATIVVTGRQTT